MSCFYEAVEKCDKFRMIICGFEDDFHDNTVETGVIWVIYEEGNFMDLAKWSLFPLNRNEFYNIGYSDLYTSASNNM